MHLWPIAELNEFQEGSIRCLGDAEYQQRVWREKKGPESDDYLDATGFFLERCEEIFEDPSKFEGMSEVILDALRHLYEKQRWFDRTIADHYPGQNLEAVIETEEWDVVRSLARKTYNAIASNLKERGYGDDRNGQ